MRQSKLTGMMVIVACLVLASYGYAQQDIGLKGAGGKLGLVDPENVESVIGIGAFADLGTITPQIQLEGNLDFWSKSYKSFGAEVSFRDIFLGGTVKYMFQTSNPAWRPFAAGGLGFHFVHFKNTGSNFAGSVVMEQSDVKIGVDLGGGVFYLLNEQIDLLGELKYRIVSDVNQFTLQAGVLYHLKK